MKRFAPIGLATAALLTACQSVSLDSDGPSMASMDVPTCAVAASDYKLLAYWKDRGADKNYGRILDLLRKKYEATPPVDDTPVLQLAQRFVSARTDLNPPAVEQAVEAACSK